MPSLNSCSQTQAISSTMLFGHRSKPVRHSDKLARLNQALLMRELTGSEPTVFDNNTLLGTNAETASIDELRLSCTPSTL
jgi:hypothetical protein